MPTSDNYNVRDLLQEILTLNTKIAELENDLHELKKRNGQEINELLNEANKEKEIFSASNQIWHSVFQAFGQPTLILDKEKRILAANKAVLTAFNTTEDKLNGTYCYHLFHSNDTNKPAIGCPCENIIKSGVVCTQEMEVETLKGTYLVCCTPVFNENNEIKSIIHVATDITSQKIIQEAIHENEVRVKALLDAIPDIMFRMDYSGIILDFKAETNDLYTGTKRIIGQNVKDLLPSDVSSLILDKIQQLSLTRNMQTFEYCLDFPTIGIRDYEARMVISGKEEVIAIIRDITIEKQNREALKASQKNMILAQKIAKLGSWELYPVTRTGSWSEEMFDLINIGSSEGVPSLDRFFENIHPEDRQKVRDSHNYVLETGHSTSFEFRNNPEIDTPKIFLSNIAPVINDKNVIIKLVGTLQDITEQKQTQEKIRKLNRIYVLMSEVNKTIIRVLEPEVLFKKICQIAVEKGGFKLVWVGLVDEDTKQFKIHASEGYSDEYLQIIEKEFQSPPQLNDPRDCILKGNIYVSNNLLIDVTNAKIKETIGQFGYNSLVALPLCSFDKVIGAINFYSGETDFFDEAELTLLRELADDISFAIDVFKKETIRKQTEFALAHQYHLFQFLIDSLPDHIYFKDMNSRFIAINKAQAKLFGLKDPLLAKGKTDFDFFTDEHAQKAFDDEQSILKNGNPIVDKEEKETWPDGSESWVSTTKLPLFDPQGKLIGTFGLSRDITARKLMVEEIRVAKEKAEESDRLKTAFLANMSHEIRTPMNGILGFSDLLKNPNLSGDQQQKYIRVIEQSGRRMLNIINDIIDISKIESGQMEIHLVETHVNQLIDHLSAFFNPEAAKKSIMLCYLVGLSNDRCTIRTDKNKLVQILSNLIKNAIKFTERGTIEFGYSLNNKYLEFFVKDTGIGIRPEQSEIIFERFRQANESYSREYEGAGLGLAITKAYVEMLNGTIWVESEVEKGSCFYFTIPYVEFKGQSPDEEEIKEIKLVQPLTILVADDDETSMLYLKEILHSDNIKLLIADDGREAIELVKTNKDINLVLMDLKMPTINGFEATRQIKLINPNIPVIAVSAFALNGDDYKAKAAGCDDYISKPIEKNKLFNWIESVRNNN